MLFLKHLEIKISACLILLLLIACGHQNEGGFTELGANVRLKIISFNTNSNNVEEGDLVEFSCIALKNNKDTLLKDSTKLNELFNDTISYHGKEHSNLMKLIEKLQEGDSCLALLFGDITQLDRISNAKQLTKEDTIYLYMKIKHIYKGNENTQYRLEENAIARYITFSKQSWTASENGIYYRIVKASDHTKLAYNDPIKLVYKGYFLNHQVFDRYAEINPYFEHKVGTQNQLIRGMEIAIQYMSYGTEAEFIFPSSFAFGNSGSSTGIVPAYKPVLYKVKILDKEHL